MGPGDIFSTLFGQPPAQRQLYAALGQAPGQPGSPQGPQPLAGQNAPSPSPAAPDTPQGQQQAPPTPQAYQSAPDLAQAFMTLAGGGNAPSSAPANAPPDLAQMFMAYQQQNQAREGFWGGLAGVAQALHPGRVTPGMVKAIAGPQGQDPGTMFDKFVQLQAWQQQNTRYADLVNNSDKYAKSFGVDPDMFKATITAAGPQGAGQILGQIAAAQMGLTGTQTDKEYKQQVRQFQAANPGQPLPPELASEGAWDQNQREAITTRNTAAKTKTDDLIADQRNFGPALQNYDKTIGTIDEFMQPDMQKAAQEFLGRGGQIKIDTGALSDPAKKAYQLYKNLMASQFTAGTQDFKGAGRITNQMLTQDAPSQSTMGINQAPGDFFDAVKKYRENLAGHRALLFGPAQKADDPRLSDEDYAKYVHPNMDIYGGKGRDIPDFSKMSAADADKAYEALPSGQNKVFIDTDGQPKRKP